MKIETIPIHLLDPHPDNPRLELRQKVIETIRAQLAQYGYDEAHAILVRPIGERYQILSGHHRVEAARAEGVLSIPAWVREYSDEEAYMQLALWNAQEDLSSIEKGKHAKLAVAKWSRNGQSYKDYAHRIYGEKSDRAKEVTIRQQVAAWEVYEKRQDILPFDKYFSQLVVIHGAEEEEWPALCEQLVDEDWTVEETERAVKPVKRRKVLKIESAKGSRHPVAITLEDWKQLDPAKQQKILDWQGRRYNTRFNEQKTDDIEWAKSSWNPVTGCLHNCPYCYAREIAEHIYPEGFQPTLHVDRLSAPALTPVPPQAERDVSYRNVFTCSMADLFGRWVPDEWIQAVLEVVRHNPQWNFLFLTKFPIRMSKFTYPSNAWLGTSVDLQRRVKNAERAMREVKAPVKWLSLEPLIEPLQFEDLSQFQWVVIGGASPTKTSIGSTPEWKPPRDWVWTLTQQAQRAGCRVYHKTNLHERLRDFPGDPHYQAEPAEAPPIFHYLKEMRNVSKAGPEKPVSLLPILS